MLSAKLCVTTPNLLIQKSLNELVQAAIYTHLPACEHDGHGSGGKKFKKTVFRADYDDNEINIDFASIDKSYEEAVAKAMLKDEFRIGAVHISHSYVAIQHTNVSDASNSVELGGYVCVHINDSNGKRLYLEPRDSRFVEIITKNAKEKYETLLGEPLEGDIEIKTLWQSEKPTYICYKAARHKVYKARYLIKATSKMLNLILDTGLGSKIMQGCGWVSVSENVTRSGGVK